MKKKLVISFAVIFLIATSLLVYYGKSFFKDFNKSKSVAEIAWNKYYNNYNKKISFPFIVDSISYTINAFKYFTKTDTTILIVDISIKNTSYNTKTYPENFFALSGGSYGKIYYPSIGSFSVLKNKIQPLKLLYTLPQNLLPSVLYYLNINSTKDSLQNAITTLYENYREGG